MTGATRGLGLAIARAFAARGASLVLAARDGSLLRTLTRSVREAGAMTTWQLSGSRRARAGVASLLLLPAAVLTWLGPLSSVPVPARAEPLPTETQLPLALAQAAAEAALDACQKQGYRVSVAVVDRAGRLKALLRGDGAAPHTLDSSLRKAYTSASFRAATSALDTLIRSRPDAAGLRDIPQVLALGGGLPVQAGGEVIGGIGVGGAPDGEKDEGCARAGLDRITDRLTK